MVGALGAGDLQLVPTLPTASMDTEASFLVEDAVAPSSYLAVHARRQRRSGRAKAAAGLGLLLAVAGVALMMQKGKPAAPGAQVVSMTASEMRMRGAPNQPLAQKVASSQSLQGVPGVLPPPPPGGYNIFDPHYSQDGIPSSEVGGTVCVK